MKDLKLIFRDTGAVLLTVGFATLIAVIPPLLYSEYSYAVWIIVTALVFFAVGALLWLSGRGSGEPKIKHAMVIAALSWLIISLIGSIPFWQIPYNLDTLEYMDPLSAFFESMAGWTGTGLTMVASESQLPHTLQFWRTFIQWIGGVGVIVLTLIILARRGTGSFTLYRSEAREEKIHPSIISTVKSMWWILLLYTGIAIGVLFLAGMPLWEAVNHAMTGLTTGGFSVMDDSIASYGTAVHIVLIPIMVAGAISFAAHYDFLRGKAKAFFTDVQTLALLVLVFSGMLVLALLNMDLYPSFLQSFKYAAFQFASALTCTGFSTTGAATTGAAAITLNQWVPESKMLLSFAMILGGAAGSTAGGIKLFRAVLLTKGVGWKLKKIFLPPKSTFGHKLGSKTLSADQANEELTQAAVLSFMWLILLFVGIMVLLVTMNGSLATLDNVIFEVCSAQGNVGLSTGVTTISMSPVAKAMLIINMWVGRLEIIPILVLFRSLISGHGFF